MARAPCLRHQRWAATVEMPLPLNVCFLPATGPGYQPPNNDDSNRLPPLAHPLHNLPAHLLYLILVYQSLSCSLP